MCLVNRTDKKSSRYNIEKLKMKLTWHKVDFWIDYKNNKQNVNCVYADRFHWSVPTVFTIYFYVRDYVHLLYSYNILFLLPRQLSYYLQTIKQYYWSIIILVLKPIKE